MIVKITLVILKIIEIKENITIIKPEERYIISAKISAILESDSGIKANLIINNNKPSNIYYISNNTTKWNFN